MLLALPSASLFGQQLSLRFSTAQMLMIFGGGFVGAVSQILMTIGMQREKSATATAMRMSDVVFGFIWQNLFTRDAVSLLSLVGAMLVASSILIIVVFKPQPSAAAAAAAAAAAPAKAVETAGNDGDVEMATKAGAALSIAGDEDADAAADAATESGTASPSEASDSSASSVVSGLSALRDSVLRPLSRTGDALARMISSQLQQQQQPQAGVGGRPSQLSVGTAKSAYSSLPQAES